jgi:hypothetical protein
LKTLDDILAFIAILVLSALGGTFIILWTIAMLPISILVVLAYLGSMAYAAFVDWVRSRRE